MTVDFSQDIKTTRRQIESYVRRGQKIPKDVLYYHNSLLSAFINTDTVENGQADDFPAGNLDSSFINVNAGDNELLTSSNNRQYILIQNVGDENVYLHFNNSAVGGIGLLLVAGASWSTQIPQFTTANIRAATTTGASSVAIFTIG